MLKFIVCNPPEGNLKELRKPNSILRLYLHGEHKEDFLGEFCRRVVKEVDKSEIMSAENIISPYLGSIPPDKLSGGTSTILSLYFTSKYSPVPYYFRSDQMGDNCVPYLLELAEQYDLLMWMTHPLMFTNDPSHTLAEKMFEKHPGIIFSIEANRVMKSAKDFYKTYKALNHKMNLAKDADDFTKSEEWQQQEDEVAERDLQRILNRRQEAGKR